MPKSGVLLATMLALATTLFACHKASVSQASMNDQQLVQAVRSAAASGATSKDAEQRVGAAAIINTVRPGDRNKLRFAHVELDTAQQSEIASLQVKDVAYWGRPGTWADPHVVGIAWTADGRAKIFFAIVY